MAGEIRTSTPCAYTFGIASSASSTRRAAAPGFAPDVCSSGKTTPSGSDEQREQHVLGLDRLVVARGGLLLRLLQRRLRLHRQLVRGPCGSHVLVVGLVSCRTSRSRAGPPSDGMNPRSTPSKPNPSRSATRRIAALSTSVVELHAVGARSSSKRCAREQRDGVGPMPRPRSPARQTRYRARRRPAADRLTAGAPGSRRRAAVGLDRRDQESGRRVGPRPEFATRSATLLAGSRGPSARTTRRELTSDAAPRARRPRSARSGTRAPASASRGPASHGRRTDAAQRHDLGADPPARASGSRAAARAALCSSSIRSLRAHRSRAAAR